MKKKPLFSGIAGVKSNGRWGLLSGKEIADAIINQGALYDISRMSKTQKIGLQSAYTDIAKQTNKRIQELETYLYNTGNHSDAYDELQETGGEIPETMPKTIEEVFRELTRARMFNESDTSTPQGVEQFYDDFADTFDAEPIDINTKWNYLRRLKNTNPNIISALGGVSDTLDYIETALESGADMNALMMNLINEYANQNESDMQNFKQNARKLF